MLLLIGTDTGQVFHLLGQEAKQIVRADDADETPALVHDGHAADAAQAHAFDDDVDVVVLVGREQVVRHDVADLQPVRVEAEGDDGHDDVAVRHDAGRRALAVGILDNNDVAHVVFAHEEGRTLHAFVARAADGVDRTEFSDFHGLLQVRCLRYPWSIVAGAGQIKPARRSRFLFFGGRDKAGFDDLQVVVLGEIAHEVVGQRFDAFEGVVDDDGLDAVDDGRVHVRGEFQVGVRTAAARRPEARHDAAQTLGPVTRAELPALTCHAENEEFVGAFPGLR